jgi:signal peptidase
MSGTKIATVAIRVLTNLLLVTVLLASLGFVLPSLFGFQRYVVMGGSMTGTYNIGSIVFEKQVPVSRLNVGDIITYLPPADSGVPNLVTHRIRSIDSDPKTGARIFRTKGDNNPQRDPWTFQLTHQTQPRVSFGVPYAGFLFIALADRHTRMLVIGIPAGLIALFSLVEMARSVRTKDPQDAPADPSAAVQDLPVGV